MKSCKLAGTLFSLLVMSTFVFAAKGDKAIYVDIEQAEVAAFIEDMVTQHDFDRDELSKTLAAAEIRQSILDAISKPAERTLNWDAYRRIFITPERIRAGASFWRENHEILTGIADSSGVPAEIIVGIIGVETYFGRITGNYRVLDALSTLAFQYPPRATFFSKELKQYLLLVREEDMEATDATGSYAGAMGRPQFMPSSYRAYAIDSTGDGKRDIWNNWADVAGSIANYFNAHGWRTGEDIVSLASLGDTWSGDAPVPANPLTPDATVSSLSRMGVMFVTDLPGEDKSQLLTYDGKDGIEHWVGFHNFFVITRYNRNVKYALAVHQLGQEIAIEFSTYAD